MMRCQLVFEEDEDEVKKAFQVFDRDGKGFIETSMLSPFDLVDRLMTS